MVDDTFPTMPPSSSASCAAVAWGESPSIGQPFGTIHRFDRREVIKRISSVFVWRQGSAVGKLQVIGDLAFQLGFVCAAGLIGGRGARSHRNTTRPSRPQAGHRDDPRNDHLPRHAPAGRQKPAAQHPLR